MAKAAKANGSKAHSLTRSAVTGRLVQLPASKPNKITLAQARKAMKAVVAEKR